MAKKDKVYLPMGTGGLIRYGEEEESKIKLKPEQLVYLIAALIILEILLKSLFRF